MYTSIGECSSSTQQYGGNDSLPNFNQFLHLKKFKNTEYYYSSIFKISFLYLLQYI